MSRLGVSRCRTRGSRVWEVTLAAPWQILPGWTRDIQHRGTSTDFKSAKEAPFTKGDWLSPFPFSLQVAGPAPGMSNGSLRALRLAEN